MRNQMIETSPGSWNDAETNNVFVLRFERGFRVYRREPGNRIVPKTRHRLLPCALDAATRLANQL